MAEALLVSIVLEPIALRLGYLTNYKSKCQYLQSEVEKLSFAQERLQYLVEVALRKGEKIIAEVEEWMAKVDKVIREANDFLEDENQSKMECVPGSSHSPILRYKLSKKARKLVEVVEELSQARDSIGIYSGISYHESPEEAYIISTQDYEAFESRTATVKEILDEIRNPTTNAIGVYGIGGVGKTTLVKEVCRQVKKEKLFDHVVLVFDVNQYPDLVMLQKQISESLGMEIAEETLSRVRVSQIRNKLKDKNVLVVFDDVWASIDLEAVGIPNVVTCKILWTSRSRIVLDFDNNRTQKEFQLHFLEDEETWRLFERTAGDVIKDPTIRDVAVRVAKKCGGFPSLVISVASSLRNRSTSYVWEHSLTQLEPFVRNRLTERAYSAFEWSYEKLDEKELKPLFLLCGLTAWKNYISVEDLLKYSLDSGWFKNISIEEARKALLSLIEKLGDYCLLPDGNNNGLVRIHDLVRNYAVSVASKDQHILSRAYGDELESRIVKINDQNGASDDTSGGYGRAKIKAKERLVGK